jgi:hypothetical protein
LSNSLNEILKEPDLDDGSLSHNLVLVELLREFPALRVQV